MAEPVKTVGSHLVVSPDEKNKRRIWPNPAAVEDLSWRARYAPASITPHDLILLAGYADTYAYIFSISQREFLPTHAAVRAHLIEG